MKLEQLTETSFCESCKTLNSLCLRALSEHEKVESTKDAKLGTGQSLELSLKEEEKRWHDSYEIIKDIFRLFHPLSVWSYNAHIKQKTEKLDHSKILSCWKESMKVFMQSFHSLWSPLFNGLEERRLVEDCSISSIVNVRIVDDAESAEGLSKASVVLLDIDEHIATSFAFEAFNEAFWGNGWEYEREDIMWSVFEFVDELGKRGKYREADGYYVTILQNLSANFERHGESWEAQVHFTYLLEALLENWKAKISELRKEIVNALAHMAILSDSLVWYTAISNLYRQQDSESALNLCSKRYLKLVSELAEFKPRKFADAKASQHDKELLMKRIEKVWHDAEAIRKNDMKSLETALNNVKGKYLEDRVDELANVIGYTETDDNRRIFKCDDPELKKCVEGDQVEVDVLRLKKLTLPKKHSAFFIAECKSTKKKIGYKEVKCFESKAKAFLSKQSEIDKDFPKLGHPTIEKAWFVSVSGFDFDIANANLQVNGIRIDLIDLSDLNDYREKYNLQKVANLNNGHSVSSVPIELE